MRIINISTYQAVGSGRLTILEGDGSGKEVLDSNYLLSRYMLASCARRPKQTDAGDSNLLLIVSRKSHAAGQGSEKYRDRPGKYEVT